MCQGQFIYEDLHNVIKLMKHSFQEFLATSPKYNTPFHQHTHNTVFYYLNQIHYRILETITQIKQSYPHVVDQLLKQPATQPPTQNPDAHCTQLFSLLSKDTNTFIHTTSILTKYISPTTATKPNY